MIPKSAVDTARKLAELAIKQSPNFSGTVSTEEKYKACAGSALAFLATCEFLGVPVASMGQFLNDATQALARYPRDGGS